MFYFLKSSHWERVAEFEPGTTVFYVVGSTLILVGPEKGGGRGGYKTLFYSPKPEGIVKQFTSGFKKNSGKRMNIIYKVNKKTITK